MIDLPSGSHNQSHGVLLSSQERCRRLSLNEMLNNVELYMPAASNLHNYPSVSHQGVTGKGRPSKFDRSMRNFNSHPNEDRNPEMHNSINGSELNKLQCEICAYVTPYPCRMKVHMRSHSGEKPFMCSLCSHRSTTRGNLKVHLKTHAKEAPLYVCPRCAFGCQDQSTFSKHMCEV